MYNSFQSLIMVEVILVSIASKELIRRDTKSADDSKIVGGFSISLTKAPFLASLQKPSVGHYCGASLLTLGSVLSGCHCLGMVSLGVKKGEIKLRSWIDVTVHVGSEDIDSPNRFAQRSTVSSVTIHPECSFEKYLVYDYGVIFLTNPFKMSPTVHPFDLVSLQKQPFELQTVALINNTHKQCFVAGWGTTDSNSDRYSFDVKAVRMMLITDDECSLKLGRENVKFRHFPFADNAQACSLSYGFQKNASDCVGDSGGPFFCGKNVFGLVSYGYDCGFWDTPNVYAKLSYFVEWWATIKDRENDATLGPNINAQSSVTRSSKTPFSHNSSPQTMILQSLLGVLIQLYI